MNWERGVEEEEVVMMEVEEEEEESSELQMVRWYELLPKMGSLRVLLVEGDDSTRQIITALLRKCNYKVSAVSDGLKAWEILKERPQSVDIVLAEVEVKSISGISLLGMIMDHETCKNIPVIMMSSHDSINTVFKCMLKGAADFLVKPIRKNELGNLWQHVWRRHALSDGHGGANVHDGDKLAKQNNQDNSQRENKLSGGVPSINKNKECSEKGSDAESSCTRLDMEAESTYKQNNQEKIQPNNSLLVHEGKAEVTPFDENCISDEKIRNDEHSCAVIEMYNNIISNEMKDEPSKKVINLISRIDNKKEGSYGLKDDTGTQIKDFIGLELSLRSCSSVDKEEMNQCSTLNHSDSSAFSLYNNQMPVSSALKIGNFQAKFEEYFSSPTKQIPDKSSGCSSNPPPSQGGIVKCTPRCVMPVPIPVGGINFDSSSEYGLVMKPVTYPNSSGYPLWSSISSNEQEAIHLNNSQSFKLSNESPKSPFVSSAQMEDVNMEVRQPSDLNRLNQREAALNKFRLKRKDRCFEKKVRYQSRKRLAEQRPRVKGQFVRHTDTPSSEACS